MMHINKLSKYPDSISKYKKCKPVLELFHFHFNLCWIYTFLNTIHIFIRKNRIPGKGFSFNLRSPASTKLFLA